MEGGQGDWKIRLSGDTWVLESLTPRDKVSSLMSAMVKSYGMVLKHHLDEDLQPNPGNMSIYKHTL